MGTHQPYGEFGFNFLEQIFYILYGIIFGFRTDGGAGMEELLMLAGDVWGVITFIAGFLSLVLFGILLYAGIRLSRIRKQSEEYYKNVCAPFEETPSGGHNSAWSRVEELVAREDETAWKQAIIEADIMLDTMLTTQGYQGETIGEKLKSVEPADFRTLNYAWAGHKVRNRIAHDGPAFLLTKRDAEQVIAMYREVFKEFHYI